MTGHAAYFHRLDTKEEQAPGHGKYAGSFRNPALISLKHTA
jgi:hypothetical protein